MSLGLRYRIIAAAFALATLGALGALGEEVWTAHIANTPVAVAPVDAGLLIR